tara:strand:- start:1759 stop:3387 length:1629 start_codon:yes stop_codon:yes gene_type:complete
MVSFKWGNTEQALPDSADFFMDEMENYIKSDDDNQFIFNLNEALDSPDMEESDRSELHIQFRKILDAVLEKPLRPLLELEKEGFKKFITGRRTSKSGSKAVPTTFKDLKTGKQETTVEFESGKTQDIDMVNTANVEFLEDKAIIDLMDSDVANRLKSAGGLKYGKNLENLPDFDYNDYMYNREPAISVQLAFTEKTDKDGDPNGQYTYVHKKEDFARPQKNHIEADIPAVDEGGLSNAQADWLTEITGQKATYIAKKSKDTTFTEPFDYNIVLPPSLLSELGEDIIERNIEANWGENDKNSPFSFIHDNMATFLDMHKKFLNNPLTVQTLSVTANIKTRRTDLTPFGAKAIRTNTKKVTPKNPNPDRYEKLRHMVNSEGDEISLEEWNKLESNEKSNYTPYSSDLTVEEIKLLSNYAFRHKEDTGEDGQPIVISESDYAKLDKDEQSKYDSTTSVYSGQETGKPVRQDLESFSGEKFDAPQVTYETAVEAFKEAIIVCEFTLHTHGKFDMHPFKGGKANAPMTKYVNKRKSFINRLQQTLGE